MFAHLALRLLPVDIQGEYCGSFCGMKLGQDFEKHQEDRWNSPWFSSLEARGVLVPPGVDLRWGFLRVRVPATTSPCGAIARPVSGCCSHLTLVELPAI